MNSTYQLDSSQMKIFLWGFVCPTRWQPNWPESPQSLRADGLHLSWQPDFLPNSHQPLLQPAVFNQKQLSWNLSRILGVLVSQFLLSAAVNARTVYLQWQYDPVRITLCFITLNFSHDTHPTTCSINQVSECKPHDFWRHVKVTTGQYALASLRHEWRLMIDFWSF